MTYCKGTTLIEDRPLPSKRLAAIWRGLPEHEQFGFVLALREDLADQVIDLTYEQVKTKQKGTSR